MLQFLWVYSLGRHELDIRDAGRLQSLELGAKSRSRRDNQETSEMRDFRRPQFLFEAPAGDFNAIPFLAIQNRFQMNYPRQASGCLLIRLIETFAPMPGK